MSLLLILIILLVLFGGGGFYAGGPRVGISLGGLILVIIIVMALNIIARLISKFFAPNTGR